MIKDSSLEKFIKYKKYKDIVDLKSLEVRIAFIGAVLICLFLKSTIKGNSLVNINQLFQGLTKDIALALISFLGFTVTGLAILTGVISKKEIEKTIKMNKIQHLEKILLSFYLVGILTALVIVGLIGLYILSMSNKIYCMTIVLVLTFVGSYLIIFILFYAVRLIGNSLDIFFIVNSSELVTTEQKKEPRMLYDSYRLTALETVCLKKVEPDDLEEYMKIIKELITATENIPQKGTLEEMFKEHFGIK